MKLLTSTFISLLLIGFACSAYGQGGRLNIEGCHNQNSGGTYHCHRGPLAGQSFANRALLLIRPLWIVSPQMQLMAIVIGVLFLQLTRLLNPAFF